MRTVFVDSDAFIALAKEDDSNHRRAQTILEELHKHSAVFLTSNYVFAETITVVSQRVGREQALSFIGVMKNSESPFTFRWIDEDIESLAIEVFCRQHSKNISFVDCANIAIMQHDNLGAIFSFDSVYRKNDIRLAEEFLHL